MVSHYPYTPYCGAPPAPQDLWGRWNLDPVLFAALLAALAAYLWAARRRPTQAGAPWRRAAFLGGWAIGALALVSPLCPLSVSLFSARVGQHMLLAAVAAPLVALGRPVEVMRGRRPGWGRRQALPAALAFAVALWAWHAPAPYLATFQSEAAYWAMHVTTFAAAFWLWSALLGGASLAATVVACFLTTGQMGLLGALIAFSARPLYAPHLLTAPVWGLSPLDDQALGGALMWVPAGVVFVGGLAFAFARLLRGAEARMEGRPWATADIREGG